MQHFLSKEIYLKLFPDIICPETLDALLKNVDYRISIDNLLRKADKLSHTQQRAILNRLGLGDEESTFGKCVPLHNNSSCRVPMVAVWEQYMLYLYISVKKGYKIIAMRLIHAMENGCEGEAGGDHGPPIKPDEWWRIFSFALASGSENVAHYVFVQYILPSEFRFLNEDLYALFRLSDESRHVPIEVVHVFYRSVALNANSDGSHDFLAILGLYIYSRTSTTSAESAFDPNHRDAIVRHVYDKVQVYELLKPFIEAMLSSHREDTISYESVVETKFDKFFAWFRGDQVV